MKVRWSEKVEVCEMVFTSSVHCLLPGLGLEHAVVRVEALADHEEDHGHSDDAQHREVPPRQQGGAGQDPRGVDAGETTVHEGNSCGNNTKLHLDMCILKPLEESVRFRK